jgi:hypothetical protein
MLIYKATRGSYSKGSSGLWHRLCLHTYNEMLDENASLKFWAPDTHYKDWASPRLRSVCTKQ